MCTSQVSEAPADLEMFRYRYRHGDAAIDQRFRTQASKGQRDRLGPKTRLDRERPFRQRPGEGYLLVTIADVDRTRLRALSAA